MEKKAYLETEKKQMKKRLRAWGQTTDRIAWKGDELQKLRSFYELQKKIWEGDESESGKKAREKLEQDYEAEAKRLRKVMDEILEAKDRIDELLRGLELEESNYVQLRFEKGYGFDYIGMKMFLSRATLFRMQDRILKKMVLAEMELGTP